MKEKRKYDSLFGNKFAYKENAKRRNGAYHSWLAMIHRVLSKKNISFSRYGGRGIGICDKWMKFEGFLEDMGDRPSGTSIDRIDVDKGYFKENCRWATQKVQSRNKTNNRILEIDGVKHCVSEWAEIKGIPYNLIHLRLHRGWSHEKAVNTKIRIYARA